MAKGKGENGNPTSGLKLYGKGTETQERNPFMPLESSYTGGKKGIVSNRGSNFSLEVTTKGNAYDALYDDKADRTYSGKTSESLEVNEEKGTT